MSFIDYIVSFSNVVTPKHSTPNLKHLPTSLFECDLQWSSGSSLRRLGGTVVMRIFTVASAELISKPVSLVSMDSTEEKRGTYLIENVVKVVQFSPLQIRLQITFFSPLRLACQIKTSTHPQKGPVYAGSQLLCFPRQRQLPLHKYTKKKDYK